MEIKPDMTTAVSVSCPKCDHKIYVAIGAPRRGATRDKLPGRQRIDPRANVSLLVDINRYLKDKTETTLADVMKNALNMTNPSDWTSRRGAETGVIMRYLGWEKRIVRDEHKRSRRVWTRLATKSQAQIDNERDFPAS